MTGYFFLFKLEAWQHFGFPTTENERDEMIRERPCANFARSQWPT